MLPPPCDHIFFLDQHRNPLSLLHLFTAAVPRRTHTPRSCTPLASGQALDKLPAGVCVLHQSACTPEGCSLLPFLATVSWPPALQSGVHSASLAKGISSGPGQPGKCLCLPLGCRHLLQCAVSPTPGEGERLPCQVWFLLRYSPPALPYLRVLLMLCSHSPVTVCDSSC